ncbi:ATP-binding cassette domain-containing protein [Candidatus Eisenbacteria bacterium]|uniref:ATP-binding cassette domain-containing protein n=1 Tax=Eiseniibacteriota bacterium TaxID=2212470 RepID=A0ABV6YQ50_UNCEI
MISVRDLSKTFGSTAAVNNISFDVDKGEVLGFLGPNGAGKTTTMRILTCYLSPDHGTATVAGFDVLEDSIEVRRRVGYLPESAPLYQDMDVVSYLRFVADIRGIPRNLTDERIRRMVSTCGLSKVVGRNIGELSKGYKQRVGLAQTLIHDPEILILDEPTTGLDPSQIIEIRELIKEIGRERTVILSTHILPEVEATCSRVLIINEGAIVASGTPEELQAAAGGEEVIYVSIRTGGARAEGAKEGGGGALEGGGPADSGDPAQSAGVKEALSSIDGVTSADMAEDTDGGYTRYSLKVSGGSDVAEVIFRMAVERGWTINELKRETLSLEDVFLKLTTREIAR